MCETWNLKSVLSDWRHSADCAQIWHFLLPALKSNNLDIWSLSTNQKGTRASHFRSKHQTRLAKTARQVKKRQSSDRNTVMVQSRYPALANSNHTTGLFECDFANHLKNVPFSVDQPLTLTWGVWFRSLRASPEKEATLQGHSFPSTLFPKEMKTLSEGGNCKRRPDYNTS